VEDHVEHWAFSGDEIRVDFPDPAGGPDGGAAPVIVSQYSSDGQLTITPDPSIFGQREWPPGYAQPDAYRLDPRTLLRDFRSSSSFDEVGTEALDGVETRHLRATAPGDAPPFPIWYGDVPGAVTALDVWVDDEGTVRRLEMTTDREGFVESLSLQFSDLGEPVTIDVPPAYGAPVH